MEDTRDLLNKELNSLQDQSDELSRRVASLDSLIDSAKATAFAEGVRAGVAAKAMDFTGKVAVLKVERPEDITGSEYRYLNHLFVVELNSKLVIIREDSDLGTLHDIDLKAIGLQRIPGA
jgi:hypothetical protein